jgi:hypothetical protein
VRGGERGEGKERGWEEMGGEEIGGERRKGKERGGEVGDSRPFTTPQQKTKRNSKLNTKQQNSIWVHKTVRLRSVLCDIFVTQRDSNQLTLVKRVSYFANRVK